MKIIRVSVENWKPYKGKQGIEFASGEANITLLFGENTHGKTSLLNALQWGLYGETSDHLGNIIPESQLINKIAYKEGERHFAVGLNMQADGKDFKLKRSVTLDEGEPLQEVSLEIDQERLTDREIIEKQINNLIPQQIARFFLFDGELLSEFERLVKAAGSVQARGIKAAIEKNLGIPILTRGVDELGELSKKYDKKNTEEAAKQKQNKIVIEKFREVEAALAEKTDESKKLIEAVNDGDKHIAELREALSKNQVALRKIEREKYIKEQVDKNQQNMNEIKTELKKLTKDIWMIPLKKALTPKVDQLNKRLDILKDLKQKALEATVQIVKLKKSLHAATCEFCNQPIPEEARKSIEKEVHTLELLAVEGDTSDAEFDIQSRLKSLYFLDEAVDTSQQIKSLAKLLENRQKENEDYQRELVEINEILGGIDRTESQTTAGEYEARIAEVAENKQRMENLATEIDVLEKELNTHRSKLTPENGSPGQTESNKASKLAAQLKIAFKETVTKYRDEMKGRIQERATETFRNITTELKFDELEINENYGLNLKVDGEIIPRGAGAEQIVAMSLIEAINHLGRRKGPMFMDTPAARLDNTHRKNIMNYLPSAVTQLALFTHSGELAEDNIYFDTAKVGKKYRLIRRDTYHTELIEV
jgi:DNA sulfur modification protein DndD